MTRQYLPRLSEPLRTSFQHMLFKQTKIQAQGVAKLLRQVEMGIICTQEPDLGTRICSFGPTLEEWANVVVSHPMCCTQVETCFTGASCVSPCFESNFEYLHPHVTYEMDWGRWENVCKPSVHPKHPRGWPCQSWQRMT
eukprot:7218-Amphidinium_carterae.1